MLNNITVVYFSPTGGTKKVVLELAKNLAAFIKEIDLCKDKELEHVFTDKDVVVVGAPVFSGRIPAYVVNKIKNMVGGHAKVITVAVYGNRAYDDALLELNNSMALQGFDIVASAAFIAEHSIVRTLAKGRPDVQDGEKIQEFAEDILRKINASDTKKVEVPGNYPYKKVNPIMMAPVITDKCTRCGLCAKECPAGAISIEEPGTTDVSECMLCMRCISVCPQDARKLPEQLENIMEEKLSPYQAVRCENELFL